ncbi:MAG: TonB family protein [Bacteroidales bacterium]
MNQRPSYKKTAAIVTLLFHGIIVGLLFVLGFQKPFPLPEEEGMLISLGTTTTGREQVLAQRSVARSTPTAHELGEEYNTQQFEDAPAVQSKKKRKKRKKETEQVQPEKHDLPKEPQREVNRNALFPGKSTNEDSTQGDSDTQGNQGSAQGSKNSRGKGLGSEGSGASLRGRSLVGKLPEPEYSTQQSGRVVVRIKVNREGQVIEAKAQQSGSTLIDATLYAAAERAALRAKFSASGKASLLQSGTIVYVFKLGV